MVVVKCDITIECDTTALNVHDNSIISSYIDLFKNDRKHVFKIQRRSVTDHCDIFKSDSGVELGSKC